MLIAVHCVMAHGQSNFNLYYIVAYILETVRLLSRHYRMHYRMIDVCLSIQSLLLTPEGNV